MTHNDKFFRVELNRIGQAPPATSCQNFWEIYGWGSPSKPANFF